MTKIKKFVAPSIQEAFAMVGTEMGKDAVILGTTRRAKADTDGNLVEVVAAAGRPGAAASEPASAPVVRDVAADDVARLRGVDRDIMGELRQIDGRLKEIMQTIVAPQPAAGGERRTGARLEEAGFDQGLLGDGISLGHAAWGSFERVFEDLVSEVPIDQGNDRISVFLGPAGSGKTTSVLKIAAGVLLPKRIKPLIVRFGDDGGKDAAWLKSQCKKLKIKFKAAPSAKKLEKVLAKGAKGPILVDTPSLSNLKDEDLRAVMDMSKRLEGMKLRLVIDAAMDPRNICAIASCIPDMSGVSLVLTKLDEATRIGGAVSAAIGRHMPLAYVTGGSDVRDGIFVPDAGLLLEKVLEGIGGQKVQ
jgi:flagellar biosynthesis protein FlhF